MSEQQSRTQFNMWSIMAAPLLISANIRNMSKYVFETYSNAEVIAVDQGMSCGVQID
jgi:alpha-galactosidase